jgi:hypothetical protein
MHSPTREELFSWRPRKQSGGRWRTHASATSCTDGLPQKLLERFRAHRMLPCIETIQQCVVMSNDLIEHKRLGVCC